jgi:hypothetical protein
MDAKKIKLDETAISEILVADTDSEYSTPQYVLTI